MSVPAASYVVPLRWPSPGPIDDLSAYLEWVGEHADDVIVVDDSPAELFTAHRARLPDCVRHLRPAPGRRSPNGKVDGILTGVEAARNERVVIADDDVRYESRNLAACLALLDDAELVRPQNYFRPLSWHARWDTARSLLNRIQTGDRQFRVGDFPGTFALRRSFLLGIGGYDGRALFENLELMRKIEAAGGRIVTKLDLYVPRQPPTFAHFRSQRVRQAYDDWAMPARMIFFMAVLPCFALLSARGGRRAALALALAPVIVAEAGRRRAGGAAHFPLTGSLLAPAWIAERAVCIWIAFTAGLRGNGVRYGRGRLTHAATPSDRLRSERIAAFRPRDEPAASEVPA